MRYSRYKRLPSCVVFMHHIHSFGASSDMFWGCGGIMPPNIFELARKLAKKLAILKVPWNISGWKIYSILIVNHKLIKANLHAWRYYLLLLIKLSTTVIKISCKCFEPYFLVHPIKRSNRLNTG